MMPAPALLGCDFSSAPTRRKPIVVARGQVQRGVVHVQGMDYWPTLEAWEQALRALPAWVGGFDLPFGLPRTLVETLGWPTQWQTCIDHYAGLSRAEIRTQFAAFCDGRPVGGKFAHRATDGPAGSSPSMKWVNPPVAFMLHAGVPGLLRVGAHCVGLHDLPPGSPAPAKVALEAYPGMLARELIGSRSYKSDERSKQTPERLIARMDLVNALECGQTRLQLRLKLTHAQRDALHADASGDALDAVLCLVQAAWGYLHYQEGDARYGLPASMDPLEGWILTAPAPS